ncbi:Site-specific DNA recombinase [Saccharopolyspora antimicrobica]|uniref:Site-specific DNA recombinase n=1 Tax=Saccharopolyspora antimicrobica TaxID=455193 RepID=A0A1I4X031_9PSEU|nr:DNA invertase Pin-like site-specific DNA recombinase [Saccharopolyspora antimicrobica]SFN18972.1 Site-specific DNA recombinase [Saccharopolyspora antimicrobica]
MVLDSYARLSWKPGTKELEKIDTQFADNREVIERVGARLGEEFSDGLSAWKKDVRRPGWERLLARVEQGLSDGIVVWHTDRLFRQPRDLEKLIDLGDKGFLVYSAHGRRDLANPDDRYILRIETAHAARSSDDTQRRIQRRLATHRENGIVHYNGRVFGWPGKDRAWQPPEGDEALPEDQRAQRPEVPRSQVTAERKAIAAAAEAILAGVEDAQLAREWNAQGLRTVTGLEISGADVRDVMLRARNAGLIEHSGEITGPSTEEPIIPPELYMRLRAKLTARRRGRRPSTAYVGNGALECGACGKKMTSRPHSGTYPDGTKRRQYHCPPNRNGCGKVAADMRAVDAELRAFTIMRLSDSWYAEAINAARARVADRLAEVQREITECEQVQEELAAKLGRRELTMKAFNAANGPLSESLSTLYRERDELTGGSPEGPSTAQPAEDIARQWDHGEVADRRALLIQALGADTMVIDPAPKGGPRKFHHKRMRLVEAQPVAS